MSFIELSFEMVLPLMALVFGLVIAAMLWGYHCGFEDGRHATKEVAEQQ